MAPPKATLPPRAEGGPPPFLGGLEASAVTVPIGERQVVSCVRALFLGGAESETWNSWLRAPRLPPQGSLSLIADDAPLPATEHRFLAAWHEGAPVGGATLIELRFAPRALSTLELQIPQGRWALARLSVADRPFEGLPWPGGAPAISELPSRATLPKQGDALADALSLVVASRAARSALQNEPTLQDVWQLALPYRGSALLGVPEGPIAAQLWDGGIVFRPDEKSRQQLGERVLLQLRLDGSPLWHLQPRQGLARGYLPSGEVVLDGDGVRIEQSAFIDDTGTLRVRLAVANAAARPTQLELCAVSARRLAAHNDPRQHAELHTPLGLSLEGGALRLSASVEDATRSVRFTVPPAGSLSLPLHLPLDAPKRTAVPSDSFLALGTQLELPDPFLMNLWRALLLHTRLFIRDGVMRYGLFPGLYENGLFGVEEGWNIVSLAQLGHAELAMTTLERTFFDAEFLKKDGPHHQYRNGLAVTYALDVYTLTGDKAWLRRLWPIVHDCARWIASAFASTRTVQQDVRPAHYGLMPKHIYGGDLRTPAYSLYASSACWRGLRDAARIARILDENTIAETLFAEAHAVRADILATAERIYRHDANPPFLPFRTDETAPSPSSGDYYQLFASLILETALFGWRGRFANALTDYLHATGREVLGVPRFDVWFDRLGVDAEYARGCQLAALQRRDFDRFSLGVLGQLGLSCDPYTFVSPETAVVRFSSREQAERLRVLSTQATRCDSDPCSAGTGVMLQYLRYMLVTEARDDDDLPTGALWLAAAVPASFFTPGTTFAVSRMPTACGPISFRCTTDTHAVVYDLEGPQGVTLEVEPFYRDRDGRRRSITARWDGRKRLTIPRD
jgi:hypothetical protein